MGGKENEPSFPQHDPDEGRRARSTVTVVASELLVPD